ncbi:MAG: LemA family protein [Candidatus Cloacimonetes bacterium]|nr:LemA family protein [Candidatus Cloacimonadota bacterium]
MILIICIIAIIVIVFSIIGMYNNMVSLRNNREKSFADMDVQLRQRHDLIPNLVEAVKGYMQHEASTLIAVTEARSGAMNARTIDEKIASENLLGSALQGLKVSIERYPDLKANENFLKLQDEISDIENKIAASRRFFNSTTKEYNTQIQKFPANLLANMFGFHKEVFFDLGADRAVVSEAPKVKF